MLGVLAGRDLAPGALEAWLEWSERVVAADGGADLCRAAGREPDAIVGDLDSIADASGLTPDEDQDTSDADKLLASLIREGHESVTLIGVEGDRLDHVLATLLSVVRCKALTCRLVLRSGSGRLLRQGERLSVAASGRVSVIPIVASRLDLQGVRWPLQDAWLHPQGLVSISNEMETSHLDVSIHVGAVAVFLEADAFPPEDANLERSPEEDR